MAIIGGDVSSTVSDCIYSIRVFAKGGIVEAVAGAVFRGRKGGEKGVEVSLIGTISGVVPFVV